MSSQCSGFLLLVGLLAPASLWAQVPTPQRHVYVNDNCYTCSATLHQGPTDPSLRCNPVGNDESGQGTSCTEYYYLDGWECATSDNPCYNVVSHGSLQGGEGIRLRRADATEIATVSPAGRASCRLQGSAAGSEKQPSR